MILKNAKFYEEMTACFGDLVVFQQKIEQIAQLAQINLSLFEIDHLAVRMNNTQTAEHWYKMLLNNSTLLKQSEVNGRPIALFSLHEPLPFCHQAISVIELPFPKSKTYPKEGWEHCEIVVPFLTNETVEQWIVRLTTTYQLTDHTDLNIKISQPQVAGERLPNPSIAISLKNKTSQNNCCLKLHPYDINTIVRSELLL
ncbi:hypothetical protein EV693_11517 [Nicoletella semolina]|uniref:VOC family protein n=1 Tax=Nicoletella semolina TaxID=271160 RepID=A0A4R2N5A6_9PAST|nr:VOC family protein [Nicoletella semolina]MDH2924768.1 metalloprotein [Nicoletella semolina]TCP15985.1 hypothetical protein EV693_11517 [Nicoletella semolina]